MQSQKRACVCFSMDLGLLSLTSPWDLKSNSIPVWPQKEQINDVLRESLRGGFHRGNLQSIYICHTNKGYLSYSIYIKDLRLCLQVMTYMLQRSFLTSFFYTVRAHPEHLLYEVDRAAALRVLVMNTNERVTETEHSFSLCSSERWREVTVFVSKWPKYPFKSPEGQEGGTAGVWHTTTCLCKMWRPKQPEAD